MSMKTNNLRNKDNSVINFVITAAVTITLALTPWVNSDSLIIPKGIILLALRYFNSKALSEISKLN